MNDTITESWGLENQGTSRKSGSHSGCPAMFRRMVELPPISGFWYVRNHRAPDLRIATLEIFQPLLADVLHPYVDLHLGK